MASRGRNPDNPSDRKTKSNGTLSKIGFTATHGCENANNGPFFFWKSGGCDNALTINS